LQLSCKHQSLRDKDVTLANTTLRKCVSLGNEYSSVSNENSDSCKIDRKKALPWKSYEKQLATTTTTTKQTPKWS
jgi:hypothetical protein